MTTGPRLPIIVSSSGVALASSRDARACAVHQAGRGACISALPPPACNGLRLCAWGARAELRLREPYAGQSLADARRASEHRMQPRPGRRRVSRGPSGSVTGGVTRGAAEGAGQEGQGRLLQDVLRPKEAPAPRARRRGPAPCGDGGGGRGAGPGYADELARAAARPGRAADRRRALRGGRGDCAVCRHAAY